MLVRKDEFGISCAVDDNGTLSLDEIDTAGIGAIFPALTETVNQSLTEFVSQICSSEVVVQDKLAFVYSLRGNLGNTVGNFKNLNFLGSLENQVDLEKQKI